MVFTQSLLVLLHEPTFVVSEIYKRFQTCIYKLSFLQYTTYFITVSRDTF